MTNKVKKDVFSALTDIASKGFHGDAYQHITAFNELAGSCLLKIEQDRFEFVFQGTEEQFQFFQHIVKEKVPDSKLSLDSCIEDEFHCKMLPDPTMVFKVGMVLSACYDKFERL